MKIVLLSGQSFEIPISPEDMWIVYSLVKHGRVEAVVNGVPLGNVRRIDAERTFGDLIASSYPDEVA